MLFGRMWGLYPHSVGFMLHIAGPARLTPEIEGQLILTVRCPKPGVSPANGPDIACLLGAISWGVFKTIAAGGHPTPIVDPPRLKVATEAISAWLILGIFERLYS